MFPPAHTCDVSWLVGLCSGVTAILIDAGVTTVELGCNEPFPEDLPTSLTSPFVGLLNVVDISPSGTS